MAILDYNVLDIFPDLNFYTVKFLFNHKEVSITKCYRLAKMDLATGEKRSFFTDIFGSEATGSGRGFVGALGGIALGFLGLMAIYGQVRLSWVPYQKIRTLNLLKKVKAFLVLFATNVQFRSPYTYSNHKVKKYKF